MTKLFIKAGVIIPVFAVVASTASASLVITFSARTVADQFGTALPSGSLVQLVNLGGDGIFNPVDISDANGGTSLGQWVSGDDSLITASYLNPGSTPGDFPNAAAFDMVNGEDSILGRISRQMEFQLGDIPVGAKLGIRWFPGLLASNFPAITLAAGQSYGQFTRQSPDPLLRIGTTYWIAPGDGQNVAFDGYSTVSAPIEADSIGRANFTVIPEPASIALSLMGAAGLAMLRRRRA